jgi:hypothetical protein
LSETVLGVLAVDELLELRLNVDELVGREVELDDGNLGGLEVGEETEFLGLEIVSL